MDFVYVTLKEWTWNALNDIRRNDQEIISWYNLLRSLSTQFQKSAPLFAAKLEALYELIHMSADVDSWVLHDHYFETDFVRNILRKIRACGERPCSHEELRAASGLLYPWRADVAIQRLVAVLLMDRTHQEGEVSYKITPLGIQAARQLCNPKFVASMLRERDLPKPVISRKTRDRIARRLANQR